jgi:iron complex transport system ATP-binding protein
MSEIIQLRDVDFRYHDQDPNVIRKMNLEIPTGKVTAILGPNGTGKTTLLHLMLGLLKPDSGTVLIEGFKPDTYPRRQLARVLGLVPQFESIPFNFTVLEYLLLGRSPYLRPFQLPGEEDLAVVEGAASAVGIDHLLDKPAAEISGGERQLVHIARVLTQQTTVLLMDEPTAHLDLENQSKILRLVKQMTAHGITAVFTTHDPNAAIFAADHFILMQHGKIFEQGPLERVITRENLFLIYRTPVRVEKTNGLTVVVME